MLSRFLPDLPFRPRLCVQLLLFTCIPLNEVLYLPKDHLHQNRLRTCPTAPETPERCGEDDDAGEEHQHCHCKDDRVLWPKDLPDDRELTLDNIYQKQR